VPLVYMGYPSLPLLLAVELEPPLERSMVSNELVPRRDDVLPARCTFRDSSATSASVGAFGSSAGACVMAVGALGFLDLNRLDIGTLLTLRLRFASTSKIVA
jgi:hypothetical protein